MTKPGFSLIIPAAGSGSRMKHERNKLFISLSGKPVLWHTLRAFSACEELREVILAVQPEEKQEMEQLAGSAGLRCPLRTVPGGKTRQESVYNALKAVTPESHRVWVHDGARPFISKRNIQMLMELQGRVMNAVLAVPVKDTVKRANPDGIVEKTPERRGLWLIQTPQVFNKSELVDANEKALAGGFEGTDDASLLEWAGYSVRVVQGDYFNIKITTPEDLVLAEAILAYGEKEHESCV